MGIDVLQAVPAERLDEAWQLYIDAFDELRATAVQRHVMYRSEFDEVMLDTRVQKFLAFGDEGQLLGMSTITDDLHAVPLISPEYFERRYPARFAERQIWYVGFVAVLPGGRQSRVFVRLIDEMYKMTSTRLGYVCLDVCRYNEEVYGLPNAVHTILRRHFGNVRGHRLDEQSYWIYEFPAA